MLKRKIFWYFCLVAEGMIILIFAVREAFRPTYHYYLQFAVGRLLSQGFLALSVIFEGIYLFALVKGYEKMGAPFRRIVEAYTGILIAAGYLNNPMDAAYTLLNNLLTAVVNGLTAVHYDFFSQLSAAFRILLGEHSFRMVSIGYCLLAGALLCRQYRLIWKNWLYPVFALFYLSCIFCHRNYLTPAWNTWKLAVGAFSLLVWILAIVKMRNNRKIMKGFLIFWAVIFCLVLISFITGLPQMEGCGPAAQIHELPVLTAIDWPLRMSGPLSYTQKMLLYGGILAGMNLLCIAWMEDAEGKD